MTLSSTSGGRDGRASNVSAGSSRARARARSSDWPSASRRVHPLERDVAQLGERRRPQVRPAQPQPGRVVRAERRDAAARGRCRSGRAGRRGRWCARGRSGCSRGTAASSTFSIASRSALGQGEERPRDLVGPVGQLGAGCRARRRRRSRSRGRLDRARRRTPSPPAMTRRRGTGRCRGRAARSRRRVRSSDSA